MSKPEYPTLADIDDLHVDGEKGLVAARIGFLATLYFSSPGTPETRQRLGACIDLLAANFGTSMRWRKMGEEAAMAKVNGLQVDSHVAVISAALSTDPVEFLAHSGEKQRDAGHFSISAYAPSEQQWGPLGFLSFTVAIGDLATRPHGAIVKLMTKLCDLLLPLHGYAGLGIIRNPSPYVAERTDPFVLPWARRFPGLELDMPSTHVLKLHDGIKGINWLTVIGDTLADKLAGRARLAHAATQAGLGVIEFGGGLIIQAGPTPQFGDLEVGLVPDPYRKSDALLKPLRASTPDVLIGEDLDGQTPQAFSTAWYARFEGGRP